MESQALLLVLGKRLRSLRERAGLSVTELASRSSVSRRHVTEAEAGRANLSITKLAALAEVLEIGLPRLFEFKTSAQQSGRIALVGLRGAGKSSVGRLLALGLEVPFIELDRRVEELAGMALGAVFDLHGAAYYRRLEAEALEQVLSEGQRWVLAAGGSIVQSPATFERVLETARCVWLKARAEDHFRRVIDQGDSRPMRGRPRAQDELCALLAARESEYARCELVLDTSGRTPEELARELTRRFASGA